MKPGTIQQYRIRPYQERDREWVMKIAADTAFFGEPLEAFMDDRRLFCDIFYSYYTDLEPQHAWVADAGQEIVGFLMGCTCTASQRQRWISTILPRTAWRVFRGHYRIEIKTRHYLWGLIGVMVRKEHIQVDEKIYPAHLHINLSKAWRSLGLGKQLILAYLDQLRQEHIPGVHLMTTSINTIAIGLYERLGFNLLDARPTRLWNSLVNTPVENRCYGLRLIPGNGSNIESSG
jgi:ribosomal protein S18 acetylase RimI-like enzyme